MVTTELAAALRRAGVGEVDVTTRRRAEYSSDASNYRVVPQAIVFPRHVDEISAALAVARELHIPVTCRGGGTSIAGNAVGRGVVIDFSRHLNRVLSIDADARTATVEPGAVLDDITTEAAPHGLRFGPDPSTHARATIGGSIGNNACGSRALRYGRTADNVEELDVLLADGSTMSAREYGRGAIASAGPIGAALHEIVTANLELLRTEFGRFRRQVSGYSMEHLLPEHEAHLARFLVGTEGTLGVVTGATVALVDSPPATALAILGYPDLATAAEAVPALLPHRPVALEGMDARLVHVVRDRRGPAAVPPLPHGAGWLFVELAGGTEVEAMSAAEALIPDAGCIDSAVVVGAAARALWRIREDGAGLGGRTPSGDPAWPGWEDAAVPPEQLPRYLRSFDALLREHRLDGLLYGHFGDGCVHVRIDFPFADGPARFTQFVTSAAELVGSLGGSLSGEHGDGRARGALLAKMYSPAALGVMAAVKRIFDPANLLNPGVIIDPAPVDVGLRVPSARPLTARLGFSYRHDRGDLAVAAHRCVGVGKCRADSGGVMCPSYLATRDEKDSTRGRARVLQELANGSLVGDFAAPELADSLDLCLSCRGCSSDCPAGVDMAMYKAEVLHQKYRRRLRPASHYSLGWLPRLARIAARTPRLANAAMRSPRLARVAKHLGGIDERRALPEFAAQRFRSWYAQHVPPDGGRPVLLWVDTFTEHFDPRVGIAAVRVLEAAGYRVQVTDRQVCCGLTWVSTGQLDAAKRRLRGSLDALDELPGMPVVGLEPSCTAVLRSDVTELLPDDPRAADVAGRIRTLAELLVATPGWMAPDLRGTSVLAQPHCHHHAVMGWATDDALLRSAGADLAVVGGCCGLAGNFGVERGHYDVSVAVAETALLPAVRGTRADSVVLADGFSCRTQLDQLAAARGVHLAELLAGHLTRVHRDPPQASLQGGRE